MSTFAQNEGCILPEYTVDDLETSFKVILVDSARCIEGENGSEIFIPDQQGLIKQIAVSRAAHPLKLRGRDIKFLRKTLGLKSKDLAEKLDIGPEHLSRCESGDKILSPNSEKVLRTLVLLEAVYVVRKALEDCDSKTDRISDKISKLLDSLKEVVSGLKISPIHTADEELVFHFRRETKGRQDEHANDSASDLPPEWLDEAA
jgi:DNA-binding transcriptional regulator YiaG